MSTAVERYISNDQIEIMKRLADAYHASGYFSDAESMAQAFVKISAGAEMGLLPFESMMGIDLIDGKQLSLSADLMSTKVKEHAKYDYRVREISAESCTIVFYEHGEEIGVSTFTLEDAKQADLTAPTRNGRPSNYVKYPRNMLFARAMTNGVAWFCPDVTRSHIYLEGNLEGQPIPRPPEPDPAAPPAAAAAARDFEPAEEIHDAELVDDEPTTAGAAPEDTASAEQPEAQPPRAPASEPAAPAAPPRGQVEADLRAELIKTDQRTLVIAACKELGIVWGAFTPGEIMTRFYGAGCTAVDVVGALLTAGTPKVPDGPPTPMGEGEPPFGGDS